jgi:hypothetical protein
MFKCSAVRKNVMALGAWVEMLDDLAEECIELGMVIEGVGGWCLKHHDRKSARIGHFI